MNFSSVFRKLSAETTSTTNVKTFIVLNDEASKIGLDEDCVNYLLESRLKSCPAPLVETSSENIFNLKSNINELGLENLLKEDCMTHDVHCHQTSQALNDDFKEFSQSFRKKTQYTSSNSHTIEEKPSWSLPNRQSREQQKHSCPGFVSAAEELNFQNNKFGSSNKTESNAPRKTLGTRRPVGSSEVYKKFVSPLLSNKERETEGDKENKSRTNSDENIKVLDDKMVEIIKSEIMHNGTQVDWSDIAGLQFAKSAIQEAVIWPMLRPDIFTGLRRPPKGILLFGPPGTGKTLIGRCVASQSKSTFFSISASSLTSKWVGEGEKMVRTLFAVARSYQPAVIFIDEIDSLLTQRNENEHESSRRIKTEFLVQLDGATTSNEERLLLIAATNRPQELDEAARRRFVKRLYIPLPQHEDRLELLKKLVSGEKHNLSQEDFDEIAKLSDGYSGADIKSLCSEASLGPIRSINMNLIEKIRPEDVRPMMMKDFQSALQRVKSSVSSDDLDQYVRWDKTFGCGF